MNSIKQELRQKVKGSMLVAADIGSEKHYITFRHPDGRSKKVFPIQNNRRGFDRLLEIIHMQLDLWKLKEVIFGMESTGNYNDSIANYLIENGIEVVLINGHHTKKLKEISDNSPLKSDMKDPFIIADIMSLGHVMRYWKPQGAAAELRHLNQFREKLVKKRTESMNQIRDALVLVFPEFLEAVGCIKSKTVNYLISNGYHDPKRVLSCDKEYLIQEIQRVSRRKQKAVELVETFLEVASTSTGIIEGKKSVLEEIVFQRELIEILDAKLEHTENQMQHFCELVEYSKYLFSIKGVGLITVAGLIGEIGDFSRFNDIRELEKYAGLNLFEVSSGKHVGTRRISKRGRAYLRKILYLAALGQVRNNPVLKKWYNDMKNHGKNSFASLIAVARKFLRICYGVVKHKTNFNLELVEAGRNNHRSAA